MNSRVFKITKEVLKIYKMKQYKIYVCVVVNDPHNKENGSVFSYSYLPSENRQQMLIRKYGREYNELVIENMEKAYQIIERGDKKC